MGQLQAGEGLRVTAPPWDGGTGIRGMWREAGGSGRAVGCAPALTDGLSLHLHSEELPGAILEYRSVASALGQTPALPG
jgi:hypothetical protein